VNYIPVFFALFSPFLRTLFRVLFEILVKHGCLEYRGRSEVNLLVDPVLTSYNVDETALSILEGQLFVFVLDDLRANLYGVPIDEELITMAKIQGQADGVFDMCMIIMVS